MDRRIGVMDVMGVRRQFVFPSFALFANHLWTGNEAMLRDRYGLTLPEDEIRALGLAGIEEYNAWVIRQSALDPDRVRPVAYLDPGHTVADLYERTKTLLDQGV